MAGIISGAAARLRTKEDLKSEDIALTREVRQLESSYKTLYGPIEVLRDSYRACKNEMVLFRYKSLKDMIKTCIERYDQMQKGHKEETRKSKNMTGAGALQGTTKELSKVMSEVGRLHKNELVQDIEEKEIRIESLEGKFERLKTSVERLQNQYTRSKQYFPTTRYRMMKSMIKEMIRAEYLFM